MNLIPNSEIDEMQYIVIKLLYNRHVGGGKTLFISLNHFIFNYNSYAKRGIVYFNNL